MNKIGEEPKEAAATVEEGKEGEEQIVPEKTDAEKEEEKKNEEAANAEYLKPNWNESVDKFDDMGLKEDILRGIYGYGFNKPSSI